MAPTLTDYDIILVNSSSGKDSQAMLTHVVELADAAGVRDRIQVVHCDLGKVEWKGALELAQEQTEHYGLTFHVVRRDTRNLVEEIAHRGKFPDSQCRYCTSYYKRDQVCKLMTRLANDFWEAHGRRPRILNCMGLRAQESSARAKRVVLRVDKRNTNGRREVTEWLPIHSWTLEDVWSCIKASGVPHHYAYDLGMPRLSCVLCVFAPEEALMLAGKHNPELLDEYIQVEKETGHTFRHGITLESVRDRLAAGEEPKLGKGIDWQEACDEWVM